MLTVLLHNYLNTISKITEASEIENKESILQEIEQTKALVSNSPKNKVMKKISSIWAKVRKKSLSTVKEFYDVFRKELMKKALWEGMDKAEDLFNIFKGLIG